jgi:filamentous hemagglutinin
MLNLRCVIGWLLVLTQVWTPVASQTLPIAVDRSVPSQRAVVGVGRNGVPIVNIAGPTAAGVSNNRFRQFNVGPSGVVFNNSGAPSQSQLAGGIAGNPMLGNGRAALILNQVTTNNPSQLRGMMEVAGHRASVIIANPAGIVCDGCGFLNAHRGTLTTGRPMIGADGGLQGFDVTRGRLSVEGLGLLGNGVDKVDLIARTLALNASVWANRLNVVAGPATVGYGDDSVQPKAGEGPAPALWLDMAALGGMYANSVRLVGTEAGVGVNIGGHLASLTGHLHVTSAGDVQILPAGDVYGAQGLNLSAGGNLMVQGRATAPRDIQMTARQGVRVDGVVATGDAAGVTLSGHDIDIGSTGMVHSGAALLADARGRLDSAGDVRAAGNVTLKSAGTMALAGSTVSQTGDVHLQSLAQGIAMTPSAYTQAAGTLNVIAQGTLLTDGKLSTRQSATLRASGNLENRGTVYGNTDVTLTTSGALVSRGRIVAGQFATLHADGNLEHYGKLDADTGLKLTTAATLINGGELSTGQLATLHAARGLENRGTLQAMAGMTLTSRGELINSGELSSGQSAALHADRGLENRGTLRATAGMTLISRGTLINSGKLSSGKSAVLHADRALENHGALRATAGMTLTSHGTLINSGELWTGQSATLHADRGLENRGALRAETGMTLTSHGTLVNSGKVLTPQLAILRAQGSLDNHGRLQADAGITLWTLGALTNRGGQVASDGNVRLDIQGVLDNREGNIRSGSKLYSAGIGVNNQGGILLGRDLGIKTPGRIDNTGGLIQATNKLDLSASSVVNRNTIRREEELARGIHGMTVDLRADIVDNNGGRLSADDHLTMNGKRLRNVDGRVISRGELYLTMEGEAGASGDLTSRKRRSADQPVGDVLDAPETVVDNRGGRIVAAKDIKLDLNGALDNQSGRIRAGGRLHGSADAVDNRGGALIGHGLGITTPGAIDNRGGLVDATGGGLNLSASHILNTYTSTSDTDPKLGIIGKTVSLDARHINNVDGTIIGERHVTVNGKRLRNGGGLMKSWGGIDITMKGAAGKSADAGTRNSRSVDEDNSAEPVLDNQYGWIVGGGDTKLDIGGRLDNQAGTVSSTKKLDIDASGVWNQGGTAQARDVDIQTPGRIDNEEGLIRAEETLALAGDQVSNAKTKEPKSAFSQPDSPEAEIPQGIIGKKVSVDARDIDNTDGLASGGESLKINGETLRNTDGVAASHGTAAIGVGTLRNERGEIWSGKGSSVKTERVTGTGRVGSQGDIALETKETLHHTGEIIANGKVSVAVIDGKFHNSGTISSGSDATLSGHEVDNKGKIVSGGTTKVRAEERISNPGLIDGIETELGARTIDNTGRIYGDRVKIEADVLRNGRGPSETSESRTVGAIAAHQRIDMGVGTFDNDHSEVYSGGDLNVGRHLDAAGNAVGKADVFNNRSGLVDVEGNLRFDAAVINNLNTHFVSEEVPGTTTRKVYYRRDGKDEKLDADKYWLCNYDKPVCTKSYKWVLRTPQRGLLMPSPKYHESQYGPELTYAKRKYQSHFRGQAPVKPPYSAPYEEEVSGRNRITIPEKFHYPIEAPIWDVFDVPRPAPLPPPPTDAARCSPYEKCQAQREAFDKAYQAKVTAYRELNKRVLAFNKDFKNRLVKKFTIYDVNETVSETRMVSSDPARILVGGNATFDGRVLNDKSQIIAGGDLHTVGGQVQNIGATGERRIEATGQVIRTYTSNRGRKHKTAQYHDAPRIEPIELAVATYDRNTPKPTGTRSIPAARPQAAAAAPFETFSIRVPGIGEVRTVAPPFTLPSSALYTFAQQANSAYLINTDPGFAGRRSFISSDYLFELLGSRVGVGSYTAPAQPDALRFARPASGPSYVEGFNGALTLKRLGDAFYEQRLVATQVMAATGQRFIGDYRDNQSQYKALLTAGAAFSRQYGLTVGTALTEDQMRHLTTDMVWMVKRDVQLPDGTTQTVLAPQVYLMVQDGDLKADGTLMAGRRTSIEADGRVENSGTIAARDAVWVDAENIVNRDGGTVRADTVGLRARQDLHLGATVRGREISLTAGRDVNLISTTGQSVGRGLPSAGKTPHAETWRTYIGDVSRVDAQALNISAGRDVNMKAARVEVDGDAHIMAGNDIHLLAVRETHGESVVYKKRINSRVEHATDIGPAIQVDGNLHLSVGRDMNATAADVTVGGKLAVDAGRDIRLLDGRETGYARDELYVKRKSGWATVKKHSIDTTQSDQARPSTFTGDSVELNAGRDLRVRGSNLGAQGDLTLRADRDVMIEAGRNTSAEDHYRLEKKSGWGATGGLSKGMQLSVTTLEGVGVTYTPSVVGSVDSNVRVDAGDRVDVKGSQVLAKKGDIDATARDIDISMVTATDHEKRFHEFKQSGFRISAGVPLLDSIESIDRMTQASSKTDNPIMKALAIGTIGAIAANTAQEVVTNGVSATITLDYGAARNTTTVNRESTDVVASTIAAGNDLNLTAKGDGKDSDITVTGSTLSAGGNATLDAEGDVALLAAANTAKQRTETSSVDGKIGVGVQVGISEGGYGYGLIVKGSVATSEGWHEGMRRRWTVSSVTAGRDVTLRSGGDTSLRGGKVKGDRVKGTIGGNLLVESLQDEHTYDAESQFANAGFTACLGYCTSSAYASAGLRQVDSDYQSVSEQTGLWAGAGGFDIDVAKNTTLKGAVIASGQRAVDAGLNRLSTGTLVVGDIENVANYDAYQVSAGAGSGGDGVGTNMPAGALAFDNASSTTRSAISGGTITVRDLQGQVALTGATVEQMVASLERDTSDTIHTLRPIFDRQKVEAGLDIATEATRQAGTFLANQAREIETLEKTANDENAPQPVREQAAEQAKAMRDNWGPGGKYRQMLGAVLAGVSGNVAAGGVQMVQAATVAYIQGQAARGVKNIADAIGKGPQAEVARAALHTIVGCVGAAASQESCAAGALGAGASSILNTLGDEIRRREGGADRRDAKSGDQVKPRSAPEQETWRNTVAALVTGIAAASGANPATAMSAAIIETENNYLNASEEGKRLAAQRRLLHCQDAACRDAEQAQLIRLAKISADRNYRMETLPEDKSVHRAVLSEIEHDMAGLAVVAKSSNRDEAKAADEQMRQAGNMYMTVLHAQKELAIRRDDVVRSEQMVEYGYLNEPQTEVLTSDLSNFLNTVASGVVDVVGVGAGAVKDSAAVAKKTATASKTGQDTDAPSTRSRDVESGVSSPVKGGSKDTLKGGIKEAKPPEKQRATAQQETGTVWDSIQSTEPAVEGTSIPRSFEIATKTQNFWVHPNATKHMVEYLTRNGPSHRTSVGSQAMLTSFNSQLIERRPKGLGMVRLCRWAVGNSYSAAAPVTSFLS